MRLLGQTKAWLRAVLRRDTAEREMQFEMAAHIEQAAERFVARGMSERDALYAARREFGTMSVIQEEARDSRGGRVINEIATDVRYALRYFARTPLTSLTIIFTLMLGIGLNAAAYSFAQGYLYNPPPGIPASPSLVLLQGTERYNGRLQTRSFSYAELMEYAGLSVFSSVAGWTSSRVILDLGDGADGIVAASAAFVTPNYFSVLNVRLVAGAGFVQPTFDKNSPPELTAIIGHPFAISQFGTPARAIGQTLRVNNAIVTVVGVTPPRFRGAEPNPSQRLLFLPMAALQTVEQLGGSVFTNPDSVMFHGAARVQPDKALREVQRIVANVAARNVAAREPDKKLSGGTTTAPRLRGLADVSTPPRQVIAVTMMFGALDLVILLVCITTVSSLLIGAAVTRRHEVGVRLALGASRWRIVRQMITETAILSWMGAVGGLALFYMFTRATVAVRMPIDVVPSWHTAFFVTAFGLFVAFVCGLSPALHATRLGLSDVLKSSSLGATSRSGLQQTFVIAQIALAQPLLVVLGMTVTSLYAQARMNRDLPVADNLIVADFDPRVGRNMVPSAEGNAAIDALSRRLSGVSGISAVVSRPNMVGVFNARPIESSGALSSEKPLQIRANYVSAEYMKAFDIKILAGRMFVPADARMFVIADTMQTVHALIVRSDFAAKAFGGGNPIGRRLCAYACTSKSDTMEIVGVASSNWQGLLERGDQLPALMLSDASESQSLLIRTTVSASAVLPAIRSIARQEAPRVPLTSLQTIAELDAKERAGLVQTSTATAGSGCSRCVSRA